MNSKQLIAGLTAATLLLTLSTGASADPYRHHGPVYDYAKVLSAEPIYRYVKIKKPVRKCWQETEYYTTYHRPPGVAGSTLAGAIIGGVVGHQFGSGRGNDAATVAGTLIGAAIGNNAAHRRYDGYYGPVRHARPVERCETRYRSHREQRIDGYSVVYRYKGQRYATTMPYDPGHRIKVRVDIRPAG